MPEVPQEKAGDEHVLGWGAVSQNLPPRHYESDEALAR